MKAELKKLKEKKRNPAEKNLTDLRQQNQVLLDYNYISIVLDFTVVFQYLKHTKGMKIQRVQDVLY
jgi:type III secretory pathway component EscU